MSARARTRQEFQRHFWSRVVASGDCWLWTGGSDGRGYGQIRRSGRGISVHRLAYALLIGPIPGGLCVLHHCDNTLCVRPAHLFLGTHSDNMADMVVKGRQARTGNPKLTSRQVRWIRKAHAAGFGNQRELADRFGVMQPTVWKIVHRVTWKHA